MHYTYNQRNVTYSIVVSFCYSCWNFSDKKQPIHHTVVCSRLERTTTTIAVKAAEIVPALLVKATGRTRWRSTRINGFTLPALHAPLSVISCGKQVAKKWTKSRQAKWEEKTQKHQYTSIVYLSMSNWIMSVTSISQSFMCFNAWAWMSRFFKCRKNQGFHHQKAHFEIPEIPPAARPSSLVEMHQNPVTLLTSASTRPPRYRWRYQLSRSHVWFRKKPKVSEL